MPDVPEAPETPDKPDEAAASAPDNGTSATPEKPDMFSENFDPADLAPELLPAWKLQHADYTRKMQEVGQERQQAKQALEVYEALQDPSRQAEVLSQLGIELEDDSELEDLYEDDPNAELRQRLEALEAERQEETSQVEAAEFEQMEVSYVASNLDKLETGIGRKLTEKERTIVGDLSRTDRFRGPDGAPDVQRAYDDLAGLHVEDRQRYVSQKREAALAPLGTPGSEAVDLKDPHVRQKLMAEAIEAGSED